MPTIQPIVPLWGLFPSELVKQELWWQGPSWLRLSSTHWPDQPQTPPSELPADEERDLYMYTVATSLAPLIPLEQVSSLSHLKWVTAWILRFIHNCHQGTQDRLTFDYLSTSELMDAELYWMSLTQQQFFADEIDALSHKETLSRFSSLFNVHPFIDSKGLLCVGGRGQTSADITSDFIKTSTTIAR